MSYGHPDMTVIGNLTDDVKLDYTRGGKSVAKGTIVVNTRIKQADGGYVDGEPGYVNFVIWGDLGENAAASLTKGTRVMAMGSYGPTKPYTDKNGSTQRPWELNVQAIGPDLRYVQVQVKKLARASNGQAPTGGDDPWATR